MKADINVTPLIDVLLVLLIIFMLVTPVAPTALDAALPDTPRERVERAAPALVVEVRPDTFALNGIPVLTAAGLEDLVRRGVSTRGDGTVFVRVAAGVEYARVVDALDAAKGAGAARIGLVDEPSVRPWPVTRAPRRVVARRRQRQNGAALRLSSIS